MLNKLNERKNLASSKTVMTAKSNKEEMTPFCNKLYLKG